MPQCCFCFLQTSGECETDPAGERLYGALWREKLPRLAMRKEHWAKSAGPALANPHWWQGDSWLKADVAPFTVLHRPNASNACSGKVFSQSERQWDFWLSKDWKNRVPRLLFSKQTKKYNLLFTGRKTQFVILMKLLHSAELNASAAKMAPSANKHDRSMPPTTLPKHKEHFEGTMSHSIP